MGRGIRPPAESGLQMTAWRRPIDRSAGTGCTTYGGRRRQGLPAANGPRAVVGRAASGQAPRGPTDQGTEASGGAGGRGGTDDARWPANAVANAVADARRRPGVTSKSRVGMRRHAPPMANATLGLHGRAAIRDGRTVPGARRLAVCQPCGGPAARPGRARPGSGGGAPNHSPGRILRGRQCPGGVARRGHSLLAPTRRCPRRGARGTAAPRTPTACSPPPGRLGLPFWGRWAPEAAWRTPSAALAGRAAAPLAGRAPAWRPRPRNKACGQ